MIRKSSHGDKSPSGAGSGCPAKTRLATIPCIQGGAALYEVAMMMSSGAPSIFSGSPFKPFDEFGFVLRAQCGWAG
jgi:hypothetical protein